MVPLVLGTAFGLASGYSMIQSIVIGSLLASHTLLSLPIVTRLGAVGLEPVVVAIGATVVSDTLSLIIFAICVSTYTTGFSQSGLAVQIGEVIIFVPLILIGVSRVGAWILSKLSGNEEGYFVTMLGIMVVAGVLADLINLPGIVGAFLAGLSVNAAVGGHPAKEKLEFFGKALFVPIFFIVTGFLIAPVEFAQAVLDNCGHCCFCHHGKGSRRGHRGSGLWLFASGEASDVGAYVAAGCGHARRHVGRL